MANCFSTTMNVKKCSKWNKLFPLCFRKGPNNIISWVTILIKAAHKMLDAAKYHIVGH